MASRMTGAAMGSWLAVLLILSTFSAPGQNGASRVISVRPGDDVQSLVDANPPGTVFAFAAAEYRMVSIVPKEGDAFMAREGAVLNGSMLLTNPRRQGRWWSFSAPSRGGNPHGMCSKEAPLCAYPEDLFFDNSPLPRARSLGETGPGEWYFDYARQQVYMGSNPTGHTVELGTRSFAFRGTAPRVTIRGLLIEKYAVAAQSAAIDAQGRDWTIQGNEIRLNHGWGVRIAPGMKLSSNFIHDNGQLGVGGTGDGVVIEGNEIARNNIARFESGWEAGGVKIFRSRNLRVVGNSVCENIGSGLWTDTDNSNVSYLNNTVENNWGPGIQHEISFSALIRGNVLRNNGRGGSPWLWGAQILVQNSRDVEVTENQVEVSAKGGNGISVVQQDRGPEYMVRNVDVHHNDVTYWGRNGMSGAAADFQSGRLFGGNNSFHDNAYHALDPTFPHWAWQDQERNWGAFRSVGQERNGIVNSTVPPPRLRKRAEQSTEVAPGLPFNSPFRSPSICR